MEQNLLQHPPRTLAIILEAKTLQQDPQCDSRPLSWRFLSGHQQRRSPTPASVRPQRESNRKLTSALTARILTLIYFELTHYFLKSPI